MESFLDRNKKLICPLPPPGDRSLNGGCTKIDKFLFPFYIIRDYQSFSDS